LKGIVTPLCATLTLGLFSKEDEGAQANAAILVFGTHRDARWVGSTTTPPPPTPALAAPSRSGAHTNSAWRSRGTAAGPHPDTGRGRGRGRGVSPVHRQRRGTWGSGGELRPARRAGSWCALSSALDERLSRPSQHGLEVHSDMRRHSMRETSTRVASASRSCGSRPSPSGTVRQWRNGRRRGPRPGLVGGSRFFTIEALWRQRTGCWLPRHSQGGTGFGSAQSPSRAARAWSSSLQSSWSLAA
jgi:hypothetical protein